MTAIINKEQMHDRCGVDRGVDRGALGVGCKG